MTKNGSAIDTIDRFAAIRSHCSARPKRSQGFWRSRLDIFEFAWRQTDGEEGEDSMRDLFRVNSGIAMARLVNTFQEFAAAFGGRMDSGMPSFVIEAA